MSNLRHGKSLFSSGQSPLKKLLNRFTKPARDLLYGNIQHGEYKKRQPAIKEAYAKNKISSDFQTHIKSTTKSNIGFSPDDKKPLEYEYSGGWQDPRMGVTVVGNKERLNRSSSSIAGSNLREENFSLYIFKMAVIRKATSKQLPLLGMEILNTVN